jgi:hypothetical protein
MPPKEPPFNIQGRDQISVTAEEQVELWSYGTYAQAWFADARKEANVVEDDRDDGHDARRREIIFAVCVIESYLLEWVRDFALKGNFKRLKHYFPTSKKERRVGIVDRWKNVINDLHEDGTIPDKPDFGLRYWEDFQTLVAFRNGFVHGGVSRPKSNTSIPEDRPKPTLQQLNELQSRWALAVVAEVIRKLHEAVNTPPPEWLQV